MPYVRKNRLRRLEEIDVEFTRVMDMTESDFILWREQKKLQRLTEQWVRKINDDLWLAEGAAGPQYASIRDLMMKGHRTNA